MRFLVRTAVSVAALWVATVLIGGIRLTGENTIGNALTLIAVAIIFGLVNAILEPLIKLFGCLCYAFTLGLIAFVVNALLFLLMDWIAGLLRIPFTVDGFGSAFWGAVIVGVVSWAINLFIPDPRPRYAYE
jgi:putative membrane protein